MAPDEGSPLSREVVVEAALAMLNDQGADALSMRGLADRLGVKAASLYWHLRDKEQLLELLAEAIVDRIDVPLRPADWRKQAEVTANLLASELASLRDSAAVVMSCLPVVQRSRLVRDLARAFAIAGVGDAEAAAFAVVVHAVSSARVTRPSSTRTDGGTDYTLAIDSGSYRVNVRAGTADVDVAASTGGGGSASIDIDDTGHVVVKNRRGGNRGGIELNPRATWYFKIHGGTWNTNLNLTGLRVSGIEIDSGGGNVTCTLPTPLGIVPIKVNSGVIGVTLHRPPRTAMHAVVSTGSAKIRLDGQALRVGGSDVTWDSPGAARAGDRYELRVYSGCVKVTADDRAPLSPVPIVPDLMTETGRVPDGNGIGLILDGIAHRLEVR